ncbi:MAG: TorD/DmsD family molecular chaperone [Georgenia sp.]
MTASAEPVGQSTTGTRTVAGRAPNTAALLADRAGLADTLDAFAAATATLSQLILAAPDDGALERVRDLAITEGWPLENDPECARGVALLSESATATANEDAARVKRDYNRLFFGPEKMKAPPYESVHRSDEGLVFEQETMDVRAAYAEFGLAAPRLNKEPDDHLGLELNFVSMLCVRAMDALEHGDDAELTRLLAGVARFLDEHLLVWAPTCLMQAANGSTTFFYQGVAALGQGTLTLARATFLP